MARRYKSYRGRGKKRGNILIAVLCVLVLAGIILVLSQSVVYTSEGLRFEGLFGKRSQAESDSVGSPPAAQSAAPTLIIVSPTPSATPVPSAPLTSTPDEINAVYIPEITDEASVNGAVQLVKNNNINAAVIDMKRDDGTLSFVSGRDEAAAVLANSESAAYEGMIKKLKAEGVYLIARMSAFKDNLVPRKMQNYSVKTANGVIWLDQEYQGWLNPYSEDALDYLSALACELIGLGFDEIMLDNFCFPTRGRPNLLYFPEEAELTREDALNSFAAKFTQRVAAAGGKVSFRYSFESLQGGGTGSGVNLSGSLASSLPPADRRIFLEFADTGLAENMTLGEEYSDLTDGDIFVSVHSPRKYDDPESAENTGMLINLIKSLKSYKGYIICDESGYYPIW
ncbi:MAG: putative glycoside hydrolase [Oscillospiraceae bacterium]|nr:putative glycoside hydrolase [Oscillospiraceae bacterium]